MRSRRAGFYLALEFLVLSFLPISISFTFPTSSPCTRSEIYIRYLYPKFIRTEPAQPVLRGEDFPTDPEKLREIFRQYDVDNSGTLVPSAERDVRPR